MILLPRGTNRHRWRLLVIQPEAQHSDVIELRCIAPELADRLVHGADQLLGGRVGMLVQRVEQTLLSKHVLGGVVGLRHTVGKDEQAVARMEFELMVLVLRPLKNTNNQVVSVFQ